MYFWRAGATQLRMFSLEHVCLISIEEDALTLFCCPETKTRPHWHFTLDGRALLHCSRNTMKRQSAERSLNLLALHLCVAYGQSQGSISSTAIYTWGQVKTSSVTNMQKNRPFDTTRLACSRLPIIKFHNPCCICAHLQKDIWAVNNTITGL